MPKITYGVTKQGGEYEVVKRVKESEFDYDWDAFISPTTLLREVGEDTYKQLIEGSKLGGGRGWLTIEVSENDKRILRY